MSISCALQVHFDSHFNSDDELDELWTRLQTRYVGNGAGENPCRSHSSPELELGNGNSNGSTSGSSDDEPGGR